MKVVALDERHSGGAFRPVTSQGATFIEVDLAPIMGWTIYDLGSLSRLARVLLSGAQQLSL